MTVSGQYTGVGCRTLRRFPSLRVSMHYSFLSETAWFQVTSVRLTDFVFRRVQ